MDYLFGGYTDVGFQRDINEDYVIAETLDDNMLFAIVADGAGSKASGLQASGLCAETIVDVIRRIHDTDRELLIDHSELFLKEALLNANRVLGGFKFGNEELYAGFASSLTCVLAWENGEFAFAHCGNTRLYFIRIGKDGLPTIKQVTHDHTVAQDLLDQGTLTLERYYASPDRLRLTSGLGVLKEPLIQTFSGTLQKNDFLLMTTDGVHYALRQEAMGNLVLQSDSCVSACQALTLGARSEEYPDNESAFLIWRQDADADKG